MRNLYWLLTLLLLVGPDPVHGAWTFEGLGGDAWETPSRLVVRQQGFEDLRFQARFRTEAFRVPVYWVARLTWWRGDTGWAMDLNHHKLYLENPPPEIQNLSVTHGYNLATIQILRRRGAWHGVVGFGGVLAHPESTVRERKYPESDGFVLPGHSLAGPVVLFGVGAHLRLAGPVFLTVESRATFSTIDAPIERGDFSLRHTAFHVVAGLGLRR